MAKKLPFGFEKPEDSPGFLLWQTSMTWSREIKKSLGEYDISHAQFVIMATLRWFAAHKYDTTQIGIINWTKLDKMTVSKSLKKLEMCGYVKRSDHEVDTRAKNVLLTKRGDELIGKLVPIVEAIDEKFFGQLSQSEQKTNLELMSKLVGGNNHG